MPTRPLAIAVAGTLVALNGAASGAEPVAPLLTVSLHDSIQLRVGQAAFCPEASLTIRLVSVTADSRCAKGERCLWEGDAVVGVTVERVGQAAQSLELHTAAKMRHEAGAAGYALRLLRLEPPRVAAHRLEPGDYRATLELLPRGAAAPSGTGKR